MGDTKSQTARQEVLAFHAALLRLEKEGGTLGRLIPTREWEANLARTLGVATRQTANDKTWFMESLGLIQRRKREGIILLDPNTPTPENPA